eukprot:gene10871-biopygen21349
MQIFGHLPVDTPISPLAGQNLSLGLPTPPSNVPSLGRGLGHNGTSAALQQKKRCGAAGAAQWGIRKSKGEKKRGAAGAAKKSGEKGNCDTLERHRDKRE